VLGDQPIDGRSDLWAVAAIVYKMVVGRSPFGGGRIQEIGMRILSTEPIPPSQIWPDLPIELDMWMQRGLSKKPSERFQSARELADFLATVAGISGITTSTAGQISVAAVQQRILAGQHEDGTASARSTNGSQIQSAPPPPPRRTSRWVVPAFILTSSLLVIVVVMSATSRSSEHGNNAGEPIPVTPSTESTGVPSASQAAVTDAEPSALPATPPVASASATEKQPVKAPIKVRRKKSDGSGWSNKSEL
jgi:serine/threonine protein kinase